MTLKDEIDRLKIVEYRLKQYAISTPLKQELRATIEDLEDLNEGKV